MKMKTFMCALLALPALAFGQDMQVTKEKGTQAKTERVEKSAPQVKAQERNQTNVQVEPRFTERERNQTTVQTGPKAKFSERTTARVSRTEVIQRHPEFRERHDKVFFEGRFGHHFRFFQPFNEYFVFVDGCWVAVDVDGFAFTDQVICPGDPNFVEVEIE